jgi:N-acyl-D-aspartate/D-glutamate deacylase
MAYDLLVKNGRVVDGSGMPSFHGDVAVKDGKIAQVGKLDGPATRTIDAGGRVVAPGFIDNHCHYDAQVTWDPLCTFSCYHGSTTVVIGNCSLALAPVRPGDEEVLAGMLARVEAIPMETLQAGVNWSWETIAEYFDALDQRLGVNVGALIGHSAVRRYAMGEESQERAPTGEEMEEMKAIIREGMAAGALGLSFNRNPGHFDLRGKILPSALASTEEIFALAETLGEIGIGTLQSGASGPLEVAEGLCSTMSQVSGRPVVYNQIRHRPDRPDYWKEHLAVVEESARRGLRAYPFINPSAEGSRFTMKNSQSFDRLPTWAPIMTGTREEKARAFRDPKIRAKLRAEAVEGVGIPTNAIHRQMDQIIIVETAFEKNASFNGRSVAQVAQEQGKDTLDAFLDLVLEEKFETTFESRLGGSDEEAVATMLKSPYTVPGLSDGGAHVAFTANYGYTTYLLGYWVRERQVLTLEEAVHKLTFVPASLFGMDDRGLIRPGMAADLVVFDPDTVGPEPKVEVRDMPAGAMRIKQMARGIDYTVVNGQVLIEGGEHTGAYPGRVIRNSAYSKA